MTAPATSFWRVAGMTYLQVCFSGGDYCGIDPRQEQGKAKGTGCRIHRRL